VVGGADQIAAQPELPVTIGGEAWVSFSEFSSSAFSLLFYSSFALASAPSTDRLDRAHVNAGKILLQRIVENLPHFCD